MEQKGAQDPRYIRAPKLEEYKEILKWSDDIIRWSAAPELDGSLEFGRYIRERGILPSIAHTDAIYEEVRPVLLAQTRVKAVLNRARMRILLCLMKISIYK